MARVRADLHTHLHTCNRFCPRDFNKAINIAAKRLGKCSIVGLINFGNEDRYERFTEISGYNRTLFEGRGVMHVQHEDIVVVKGQEIPTKEGHIVVLGLDYDERLKSDRSLKDTLLEARENDSHIVIIDHPFHMWGAGPYLIGHRDLLEYVDAIEVHNGEAAIGIPPRCRGANDEAWEFYKGVRHDFPHIAAIAASDSHSLYELGTSWTEIEQPPIEYRGGGWYVRALKLRIKDTAGKCTLRTHNSRIGALDHIIDLVVLKKVFHLNV